MITYKVSYVVIGGEHPGAIVNEFERPEVGGRVRSAERVRDRRNLRGHAAAR